MKLRRKIDLLNLQLKRDLGQDFFGLHTSVFHGTGVDFAEHREYVIGDSIKHIDWKASAKADKIFTKKFEEERDLKVLFLLDTKKSMFFGSAKQRKIDILEELFYGLSLSAYEAGDSVGVYFFGGEKEYFLPPNKKRENIFHSIAHIENIIPENLDTRKKYHDFGQALERLKKMNLQKYLIFVLTDEVDFQEHAESLKKIQQKNEMYCINIFDRFENHLLQKAPVVSFSGDKGLYSLFLGNTHKIKKYEKLRFTKDEKLKKFFASLQVRYTMIEIGDDIFRSLLVMK